MKIGDPVMVFDRYRLSTPAEAVIEKFSESNDGVQVKITSLLLRGHIHGDNSWPQFWVHKSQLMLKGHYQRPEPLPPSSYGVEVTSPKSLAPILTAFVLVEIIILIFIFKEVLQ